MLRKLRIIISVLFGGLITFFFLDFAEILPDGFHRLAHVQFVPAVVSLSVGILLFWIVLTLLFGRLYCSTICPMGAFQDATGRIARLFKSKKQKRFGYSRPRNILRWTVVGICVLSFLFASTLILSLLDPYSAYGRMVVNLFRPIYLAANNVLESIFTGFNNYTFYKAEIYIQSVFSFVVGLVTLFVIGFLAWKHGRLWCNTICPVGTLLGLLSKYSLFKMRINADECNKCGICATKCKSSCINSQTQTIDGDRCVACFNCLDACKTKALTYTRPRVTGSRHKTDKSKRRFISAGVTTAAILPQTMKAQADALMGKKGYNIQHAIAPPGAISHEHFQRHCTSCHLCISKCPSKVLKPAFMEYGLGGIMQPTVSFEKGFCNFDCTVCGNVCPNNAIKPLTTEEKHLTQMGYVVFIQDFCIVQTEGTNCGACSEHCPTQAIAMVPYKDGGLTIPEVTTDICVGCGGCEFICPSRPRAVHIEGNRVQKQAKPFEEEENKDVDFEGFGF